MTTTMTIRLEESLKTRLDKIADATQRSKSFLANEALREYIDLNEWQIKEIKAGIKEADRGDFASDEEIEAIFTKWS